MFRLQNDFILIWVLRFFSLIAGMITLLIFVFIFAESWPALKHAGLFSFFTSLSWNPQEKLYNLSPMLAASLLSSVLAVLISAPLGVLIALFCRYYAPRPLAWIYRRFMELLSGIPSVVFGFWGLVFLVPIIAENNPPGTSLLTGVLILSMMILPTMTMAAEASFANVSSQHFAAAYALGLSRFRTLFQIVIPSAKKGLFAGLILQSGRALGETMALLMVSGNVVQLPDSLFAPMRTLSVNMALEMAYALGDHRSALFVSGLILIFLIIILVSLSHLISKEAL